MPLLNYVAYFHGEETGKLCHKLQVYIQFESPTKTQLEYGGGGGCLIYIISLRKAVCEYITGLYFQSQSTSVIVGAELYCSVEFVTSDIAQGTVHRANICFTQLFLPNPFSSIPIQLHHSTKNKSRTYWVRSVAQNICPLGSPTQGTHFQRLAFTACFLSESKP